MNLKIFSSSAWFIPAVAPGCGSNYRMDALISEMTMILEQLPSNVKVGITTFSSGSDLNNK